MEEEPLSGKDVVAKVNVLHESVGESCLFNAACSLHASIHFVSSIKDIFDKSNRNTRMRTKFQTAIVDT